MKTIDLPVIHRPSSLNDVVRIIRDADRSGIIYFQRPMSPRVILFQDVVRGLRFGTDDLERVRFEQAWLSRPPDFTRASEQADVPDASRALRLFRRTPYSVGVLDASRDIATVAAKDDRIIRTLSVVSLDCFCRGTHMHGYRRPPPPECPHDHARIDCY